MHHPNLIDLPPEVDDAPRRFATSTALTWQLLATGLLLLAGGAVAFDFLRKGELQGKMAALPFFLLPAGIVLTVLQVRNLVMPLSVHVTQTGFAVGPEECAWDEVVAIREQLHPNSPINNLVVWVRRSDGWVFKLPTSRIAGLAEFLAIAHERTGARIAKEVRAALDRGEPQSFGPIELTTAGLQVGNRFLPWEELNRVEPDAAGDVGIWATGRSRVWLDVATGKVDNLRVLLELVEEFSSGPTRARPLGTGTK